MSVHPTRFTPTRTDELPEGKDATPAERLRREFTRLLRLEEHIRTQLQLVEAELESTGTRSLLEQIREVSGSELATEVGEIQDLIRLAIKRLYRGERALRRELDSTPTEWPVEGIGVLPQRLARFLADRADHPGFTYEVIEDEVRGWIIQWKEFGPNGVVRGSGQFYERPYAWLDE